MRQCKLFGQLLKYLTREPAAYAILNSAGDVDIESMGWSEVPSQVRATAVERAFKLMKAKDIADDQRVSVGDCDLHIGIITVSGTRWGMVSVAPRDPVLQRNIAREETRPLCHWD
jgi:hypothetical protein